jgi:hypothetical protein
MPFLVRAATGLPLQAPTSWIVSKRRPSGSQPNTLRNDLRAPIYLYPRPRTPAAWICRIVSNPGRSSP